MGITLSVMGNISFLSSRKGDRTELKIDGKTRSKYTRVEITDSLELFPQQNGLCSQTKRFSHDEVLWFAWPRFCFQSILNDFVYLKL